MKNKEISDIFERMGTLLEIQGENVFKVRAYFKAAENISALGEDIADLRREDRLSDVPGIGETLRAKIAEYLDTGKMSAYEKLTKEIPETLLEVVGVPSVGPKKAKLFYDQLKVKSLADLQKAVEQNRLDGLPGIKEKTITNIREGIAVVRQGRERMNLGAATRVAGEFIAELNKLPEVKEIAAAGSLRRGSETVRDIDILVDSPRPQKVMDVFVNLPQVKSINAHGETKSSILTQDNVQVDLRVVDPDCFGAALLYFTGSKNFNVKLRQLAIRKDMKVSEYGVFSVKGERERRVAGRTEKECLEALDLPYIPPELREDIGETELFSGAKIPRLIELKDIRGEVHVHSTWSDGRNTIADMAEAARKRGYEYLAVSDHSERLRVARGVSPADLKKKKAEIDKLNAKLKGFRVLFGTEVEIDSDGNLDYNEAILGGFDVVVASIHSGFEQGREQLTRRLVTACRSRHVDIIAHPTGRHIGKREPYDIDLKEVCRAAADTGTALEINAFPIRLDLDSANVYFARSQGVKFVINTDAHAVEHLDHMRFGVSIARRGWLTKDRVLNTLKCEDLLKALK
ncbi:MAG: DNA polymerase/3'-5' exonuclease PolX [Candidatus Omnitrophota bacterium]|nr:DNA polymerase/3'-5' exonuclease PolX [Candidatus Omnitrophota bacterium]MDZ4243054.1 DNA polymerase/3'-5' exonuclease PolX [Candidatus Omnitrophota bacterium]